MDRCEYIGLSNNCQHNNFPNFIAPQVITHPGYTSTALQNDIALLKLNRNVVFRTGLRPACLPDQYSGFDLTQLRTPPVVVGWGSTVTGGSTVNALREVILKKSCQFPECNCPNNKKYTSGCRHSDWVFNFYFGWSF